MALFLSTGFENVFTNSTDWNSATLDKSLIGAPAIKQALNGLYFRNTIIRYGSCYISTIFDLSETGSRNDSLRLTTFTPISSILDDVSNTDGQACGLIGDRYVGHSLVLAASAFVDGFFCSYKSIIKPTTGILTFGIIEHKGIWYCINGKSNNSSTISLHISNVTSRSPQTTAFNLLENPDFDTVASLSTPLVTERLYVNTVKWGITQAGVIKARVNDVEVQYNTGQTWAPVASSWVYLIGQAEDTTVNDSIGSLNGSSTRFPGCLDDLTINDGTGLVDNDLPPIREGYSLTRPQGYGNYLLAGNTLQDTQWYVISARVTQDFTLAGSPNNTAGTFFKATSSAILGSGDIVQERFSSVNIGNRNSSVPVPAGYTNEETLLDFDVSTYSKFFRGSKFGIKLPPLSSVVEVLSAYEDNVLINIGARNLGINTNAQLGVELRSSTTTLSSDIIVDTVEKYAGGFFSYKSGTTKFTQADYNTLSATIFREDI